MNGRTNTLQDRIVELSDRAAEGTEPHEELRGLTEMRRDPHGRFFFVRKGVPLDLRTVRIEDRILGLKDLKRYAKRQRYLAKLADRNYRGPKMLAEGDSWFEYPYARDLIDWLGDRFAVLSLARAGDTWNDIHEQEGDQYGDGSPKGLFENIREQDPDIVML